MNIPEKMRAVYLVEPQKFEIREEPVPKIGKDTDVLVKVHAVGVCGSDLAAWRGVHPDVKMPSIPGHEIAGEVVAVGKAVTKVKVGDKVVFNEGYGVKKEKLDGEEVLIMSESDILAVIED